MLAVLFVPAAAAYLWLLRGAEGFRFARPWALALIPPAVALVLWTAFGRSGDRQATLRHSRASELGAGKPGLVARLKNLPLVLRLFAVTLTAVALARPQTPRPDDSIEREGIDIVLSLDLSGSMEETDLQPNRLEAAKRVIDRFVRRRPNDRLGLVVFAQEAYTYVPLTLDHEMYRRMLADLRLGMIDGRGTAIGNGVGVALNRLKTSEAKSKVVILLTDGESNAGNISPTQAARYAQALGVKVYTILAGDNDAASAQGRRPVNPKLLEEIASLTGGTPYLATDSQALARDFQRILEDLERSRLRDRGIRHAELYHRFLWPAFLAFALEIALRLTRWRRLP
jgi:Ca-activated chloride channel homolog